MSWLDVTRGLLAPEVVELPRVADRVSFMYLDAAAVHQDETGVLALSDGEKISIPCASTLVLFLGPGTSLTQPAALTLARHGTTVVWCGYLGAGVVSVARPLTSSSGLAEAQALAWADETRRREIARSLLLRRFPGTEVPVDADLDTLRGLEGARVKAVYSTMRKIHGLPDWKRRYDNETDADPVNIALSVANSMLYSVAVAVVAALGLNPALGFLHSGNARSLALDLGDLYKVESAIPSAFACASSENPARDVRISMRSYLAGLRIHAGMVKVLVELLGPFEPERNENLLQGEHGAVEGGWNQDGA